VNALLSRSPPIRLALIGYAKLSQHYENPVANIQAAGTAAQIARGEKLANIRVSCHTPDNQLPLSGSNFVAKFEFPPFGTLYAPNLTPSSDIQGWTDGEVFAPFVKVCTKMAAR
jgi:hypothetical protein